jgi:hypothetical protein
MPKASNKSIDRCDERGPFHQHAGRASINPVQNRAYRTLTRHSMHGTSAPRNSLARLSLSGQRSQTLLRDAEYLDHVVAAPKSPNILRCYASSADDVH